MGWRAWPVRCRAAAAWIPALALVAGAGLWNSARAQVGIEPSIDVDVSGAARIAFFDLFHGDLEFASRSSSTGAWTLQRVDVRGGKGQHPSLADSVTASGSDPAISYYDQENGDLVYAKRSAGVWKTSTVDAAGDVGSYSSLKFNVNNVPAIAYFDATNGALKFANLTAAGWSIETVDAGGVGSYCSLAFDANGLAPHIAYYDATNKALKLARKSGSSWIIETVPDVADVGEYCSLAFDGFQGPRISYFDAGNGDLKLAKKSGTVWSVSTVDAPGMVGRYTSLRIDTFHNARIAYYDDTNGDLKVATGNVFSTTITWSLEVVAEAGDVGRFASVALDVQGNPRVCAYDVNNGSIRYGSHTSSGWKLEPVDAQVRTGRFTSLAIDAQGTSHAGFFDAIHGHLVYARRAASGGWSFESPDASDQAGQYVSLALGAGGAPAMSYYDATEGELRFASRATGAWLVEVVDATGIAGMFSSLAFYNGVPRIAYFDARNEALMYATRTVAGWNLKTVDTGPGLGLYASLAVDGTGNPIIAYFDAVLGDLKLATWNGSTWSIEVAESAGNVGQYASIAQTGGTVHIGYHDETAFSPRYAVKSGSTWLAEPVDTAGSGGLHTSLVLDGDGDPHIAYYDEPKSSLRYAVRSGVWTSPRETADNIGNVGRFVSLALDGAGNARAVYYDATNHALQYSMRDGSGAWVRENLDGEFPFIHVWSFTGAFEDQTHAFVGTDVCAGLLPPAPDSSRTQARTLTVRFRRDRRIEARPDFGGYRIYRVTQNADTSRMELIRRFSRQRGDFLGWYMSVVDTTDPVLPFKCGGLLAHDSIATFVDPDSNGHYEKFCPELLNNRCVKDSVWRLVAPPGPHDGIPTYYAVTIEAINSGLEGTYEDLYVPGRDPDTRNNYELCKTVGDPATCPRVNLNNKSANVTPSPGNPRLEPTAGPMPDLEQVLVVPNPYRAAEVWDQPGSHEVHFINLPQKATIKIFTIAGDLVTQLEHNDPVRDFEPWNLKNGKGNDIASGIYIYRIESPKCDTCVPPTAVPFSLQNRMVVIR